MCTLIAIAKISDQDALRGHDATDLTVPIVVKCYRTDRLAIIVFAEDIIDDIIKWLSGVVFDKATRIYIYDIYIRTVRAVLKKRLKTSMHTGLQVHRNDAGAVLILREQVERSAAS